MTVNFVLLWPDPGDGHKKTAFLFSEAACTYLFGTQKPLFLVSQPKQNGNAAPTKIRQAGTHHPRLFFGRELFGVRFTPKVGTTLTLQGT